RNTLYVRDMLVGSVIVMVTPYDLASVLVLSAFMTGLVLALPFAGSLSGAPLSAVLVPRLGQRPTVLLGVAVVGLGLLPLAFTTAATPLALVGLLLVVGSAGQGPLSGPHTHMVTGTLAPRDPGVARSPSL